YDESANVYSIDIGIRIDDKNGTFAGVMKVVLNVEEVDHIIKEVQQSSEYETIELYLVNREGQVISSTHYGFREDLPDKQFLKKMDNDRGCFEGRGYRRDKANVLLSYAVSKGYRAFRGLGWILLVEHRTDEIFVPVTKLRNNILVISVIVTIFAILISFFISRRISAPIARLQNAVTEIGKGKLDARIEVKSEDEVGQSATSFNDMAEKIERYHNRLEQLVEARTGELTTANERLGDEITNRKRAEESLRKAHDELEKRVQNRTSELAKANEQLKREITDRKLAEEALKESNDELEKTLSKLKNAQEHMSNIFQGAGDAMRVIDKDFNILQANIEMDRLAGMPVGESVGKKCYEILYGESCDTEKCPLRQVLAGEKRVDIESIEKTGCGGKIYVRVVSSPLIQNGEVAGVIESICDISKRKKVEEALKKSHDELEQTLRKL
ncbi:MAG: PAS domain S-box protein, partial [Desulfobacterales bacterium]|nr:PAS domain S-box protein [Desulfobacterales bacterium]